MTEVNLKYSLSKQIFILVKFSFSQKPILFTVWIIGLIGIAFVPAGQIWVQKNMIDAISELQFNHSINNAIYFTILLMIIAVLNSLMEEYLSYIFNVIKEFSNFKLKEDLLGKVTRLPYYYFENSETYHSLELANEAVTQSGIDAVKDVMSIIQKILSLVSICGVLALVHWFLPVALAISVLPGFLLTLLYKSKRYKLLVDNTNNNRVIMYLYSTLLRKESAKEVRLFGISNYLINKWKEKYKNLTKLQFKLMKKEAISRSFSLLIMQVSALVVAIILISYISVGNLTIGDYMSVIASVAAVQTIFGAIGLSISSLYECSLYIKHYFHILNLQEDKKTNHIFTAFEGIYIENVSYVYPNTKNPVIKNINLEIKKGETIAIVGENGAGKSTLIHCILGLFKPTTGQIRIDELDISELPEHVIFEKVAAVFQDFNKYQLTIRENVAFGKLDQMSNDKDIEKVLEAVGLFATVSKTSNGIDTYLGKSMNNGIELSGGQWQRLALARALYRRAELVVLDEPTSALDPNTELEIYELFRAISKDRTSIIISHRLGSVKNADKIVVMKNGEIIEIGSHQQLMDNDGYYCDMFKKQMKLYSKTAEAIT